MSEQNLPVEEKRIVRLGVLEKKRAERGSDAMLLAKPAYFGEYTDS